MKKDYSFLIRPTMAIALLISISFSFMMLYGYNKLAKELFGEQHGVRLTGAMQAMTEEAYSSFVDGVTNKDKAKIENSIETIRATIGIANGEEFASYKALGKCAQKLGTMAGIAEKYEQDGDKTEVGTDRQKMSELKKEVALALEEFENDRWKKITFRHARLIEKLDTLNGTILSINLILALLVAALWRIDRQKEAAREELVELNKNLEEIIAQKTEKIQAANESKSIYLSNMAHDIKTPLNSIIGFASLLSHDETIDEKKKKQIESILSSGYYILDITSDMVDIARIESGKIKLYSEKFYIEELKTNLTSVFAPLAAQKNIKLTVESEISSDIAVFGDKQKIVRVLSNLLSNALNFTDADKSVRLLITRPGKNAFKFEVKDEGKGIAQKDMERIFEPFFQVDGKQNMGNGLGLFIVKNYLEAMNSKLTVKSTESVGSEFSFILNLESSSETLSYEDASMLGEPLYENEPQIDEETKETILQYARQGRITQLKQAVSTIQSDILKNRLTYFAEIFDMDAIAREVERFEQERGR